MRVRFVVDFRGVLTNEQFYAAGEEDDFDTDTAKQLIADGRAEAVEDDSSGTPARGRSKGRSK